MVKVIAIIVIKYFPTLFKQNIKCNGYVFQQYVIYRKEFNNLQLFLH